MTPDWVWAQSKTLNKPKPVTKERTDDEPETAPTIQHGEPQPSTVATKDKRRQKRSKARADLKRRNAATADDKRYKHKELVKSKTITSSKSNSSIATTVKGRRRKMRAILDL